MSCPTLVVAKNKDPRIWGPCAWDFLESCAEGYDPSRLSFFENFFQALPEILPCSQCRAHAKEFLLQHKPDFQDASGLKTYLKSFREAVLQKKCENMYDSPRNFILLKILGFVGLLFLLLFFVS